MVGLNAVARKRSGGFSLGMGQRLGIAAALLGDPRVLMFDEPVNGLDPEGVLWIRNLLKSRFGVFCLYAAILLAVAAVLITRRDA